VELHPGKKVATQLGVDPVPDLIVAEVFRSTGRTGGLAEIGA